MLFPARARLDRRWLRCRPALALGVSLLLLAGCGLTSRTVWRPLELAQPAATVPYTRSAPSWRSYRLSLDAHAAVAERVSNSSGTQSVLRPGDCDCGSAVTLADQHFRAAQSDEAAGRERCVDGYFLAAVHAWQSLSSPDLALADRASVPPRSVSLYNVAVAKCVESAQRFGRFRLPNSLCVNAPGGQVQVDVEYHGFAWSPQDFERFMAVGNYEADELTNRYRRRGVGAALVGIRRRPVVETPAERFYPENLPFAASAVLRPNVEAVLGAAPRASGPAATLEFYEPLHTDTLLVCGRPATLAADISAPWVVTLLDPNRMSVEVNGFFSPESTAEYSGLYMVEPYQPGKIPIVLVHGVLSGPWTWTDMINELRADAALRERFQLWAFRYPTGGPMLHAAARLRSDLQAVRCVHDPEHRDAALDHMVLMGHSLGGLISKLQVSDSGCTLWASYANRPVEELRMSSSDRELLRQWYFFAPQPCVTRVVFFATPHRGTTTRNRFMGRLAAAFVQTPEASGVAERIARANPGAFKTSANSLLATSDDVLGADDRLSTAIRQLPIDLRVRLHSVIGSGQGGWGSEDSDGAVTVASARLIGAASESLVPAEHGSVHRHPASIQEVKRILREHLAEFDRSEEGGEERRE